MSTFYANILQPEQDILVPGSRELLTFTLRVDLWLSAATMYAGDAAFPQKISIKESLQNKNKKPEASPQSVRPQTAVLPSMRQSTALLPGTLMHFLPSGFDFVVVWVSNQWGLDPISKKCILCVSLLSRLSKINLDMPRNGFGSGGLNKAFVALASVQRFNSYTSFAFSTISYAQNPCNQCLPPYLVCAI